MEEDHTYFVTPLKLLVHNQNCDDGGSGGDGKTKHGEQRSQNRGFGEEKINDIIQNYSQKVYQDGGRTV